MAYISDLAKELNRTEGMVEKIAQNPWVSERKWSNTKSNCRCRTYERRWLHL